MTPTHVLRKELKRFLPWNQARLDCLSRLMMALIQVRTVNLTQVALAFEMSVQSVSVYQRVKRFFRHYVFETDSIAVLVTQWLDLGERWVLCLDRTNWQLGRAPLDLLVLSVAYRGVSVPLLWCALDKKGLSSRADRIALLERFLAKFSVTRIDCLTADREFRGHRWLSYLIQHPIPFRIRIPNNTQTHHRQRNMPLPVPRLFAVQIAETMVFNRPRKLWGHTLYLVGTRSTTAEPVIVMTPHSPHSALLDYRKRWQTECLFAAMKRRGFNLEDTPIVQPERLERLVAVLTLTMCWCYKVGEWVAQHKPITIKKHQRRARSVIRLGVDSLRRLVLNATFHATELRRMIRLLFDKTATPTVSYG